jgi:hypothetical protein
MNLDIPPKVHYAVSIFFKKFISDCRSTFDQQPLHQGEDPT